MKKKWWNIACIAVGGAAIGICYVFASRRTRPARLRAPIQPDVSLPQQANRKTAKTVLSVRDRIAINMAKGTARSVTDGPLSDVIDILFEKAEYLRSTGRHGWVTARTKDLADATNWPAYCMELHLAYLLEKAGKVVTCSKKILSNSNSDVDIVFDCAGIEIRIECVSTFEPERFWQGTVEIEPGVEVKSALYDADGEAGLVRIVQRKLRAKTSDKHNQPIKFPAVSDKVLNIIFADVTQGTGFGFDLSDARLLCIGNAYVYEWERREVLGLFEDPNPFAPKFSDEYAANSHLRERVDAVIFVSDRSGWKGPLDPDYLGFVVLNPHVSLTSQQEDALQALGKLLKGHVSEWQTEQNYKLNN